MALAVMINSRGPDSGAQDVQQSTCTDWRLRCFALLWIWPAACMHNGLLTVCVSSDNRHHSPSGVSITGIAWYSVSTRSARDYTAAPEKAVWRRRYVARPRHDGRPGGFRRGGRFKKASNMNFCLTISSLVSQVALPHTLSSWSYSA